MEIENAKITNVSISMANYCSLVFEIGVEGAGWVCNIGGYKMASGMLNEKPENFKAENGAGLVALMRIMDVVGVDRWEDLEGKYCRIKTEGWGGTIYCIGNILKDKWFDIKEFFQNYNEKSKTTLESEWVGAEDAYGFICDNCGEGANFATQYCPDCGAYMTNYEHII